MADRLQRIAPGLRAVALVGLYAMVPARVEAQSVSLPAAPPTLDHTAAANLIWTEVKPEYPPLAKLNYIQGRVRLRVLVSREGRVREAHVVHGHPFLAVSALEAVRRWLYHPLKAAWGPTEFMTVVEVNFSLRIKKIDLFPRDPERDLIRQVHPPHLLDRPLGQQLGSSVRVRVLVNDAGQVIDTQPLAGLAANFEAACRSVERWTFRPARWGALPVAWYMDVDVPVEDSSLRHAAGDPGGR